MSKSNQSKGIHQIIFIYKDKLSFCNSDQNESSEFPLTSEVVKDLGVVDQIKLEKSLKEFISKSKTSTRETLIVLNKNTYFRTTIKNPSSEPADNKTKVDHFSDLVPFNDIFVKQFIFQKKLEVVVINREFYEPILSVLQKLDFEITMILPDLVAEDILGEAGEDVCSPEKNTALIKAINKLGSYDLLGDEHKLVTKDDAEIAPIKEQNKRLMILVIVFAFLIVALIGAIIFNANRTYDDPGADAFPAGISGVAAPSATVSPQVEIEELEESEDSSPSAEIDLDQYKIRVLNGSGVSGQAGVVQNDLEEAGFSDIDIGNAQKISSNKTQVLLTPNLPVSVKKLVIDVVKNIGQEYTIQESSELNYDIVITTTAVE